MVLVVKNPLANAGDARDVGSVPGLGGSSGVRNCNPFQYFHLENPMDRGAWQATVHGLQSDTTEAIWHVAHKFCDSCVLHDGYRE